MKFFLFILIGIIASVYLLTPYAHLFYEKGPDGFNDKAKVMTFLNLACLTTFSIFAAAIVQLRKPGHPVDHTVLEKNVTYQVLQREYNSTKKSTYLLVKKHGNFEPLLLSVKSEFPADQHYVIVLTNEQKTVFEKLTPQTYVFSV